MSSKIVLKLFHWDIFIFYEIGDEKIKPKEKQNYY